MASDCFARLRAEIGYITGPRIANSTSRALVAVGPWRLELTMMADSIPEPSTSCMCVSVSLFHGETLLRQCYRHEFPESLEAGESASHPWWEVLAAVVRVLARQATDSKAIVRFCEETAAAYRAIAQDVA